MENLKSKSSILSFFIVWFAYLIFYGFFTTVIRDNGYLNFEPLYITYHLNNLSVSSDELVKEFFMSYPMLTNILSYPFAIISKIDAPYYASIFYTSFFTTLLVFLVGDKKKRFIKVLLFFYFLLSPITIYAATSGTSLYAFYILYFAIFFYLFNYIKKFTTYHITILSIILSLTVFLDYRLLWLLLILFIQIFVFSIYGVKGIGSNAIVVKFVKITQNISLRRKFTGHLNSMMFIIGFFPVVTLLLYLLTNYLMGNDFYYFYSDVGSKWNGNRSLSILDANVLTELNNKAVNDFSFLSLMMCLTPLYIYEVLFNLRKGLKLLVMSAVPILLYILLRDSKIEYMGLFYYVLIPSTAIASIITATYQDFDKKKIQYLGYTFVFATSIYGEYTYFKESVFTSEQVYFDDVVNKEQIGVLTEYKNGGRFLKFNTPKKSVILCDKSIMYPLIAFNQRHNVFISNETKEFKKAIYNPKRYCDYMIISNRKSPFYYLDKVEVNLEEAKKTDLSYNTYRSKVVFVCNSYRIVEIIK